MLNLPENCRLKVYSNLAGQDLASVAQVCKQTRDDTAASDQYVWQIAGCARYGVDTFDKTRSALRPPSARKALNLLAKNIPQHIAQSLHQAKLDITSKNARDRQRVHSKLQDAFDMAESHGLSLETDKRDVYSYSRSIQSHRVDEIMQHLQCGRSQAENLEQQEYLWGYPAY